MASTVSIFTDQENAEVRRSAVKNAASSRKGINVEQSAKRIGKTPTTSKHELRSALGDVSNSFRRLIPNQFSNKKCKEITLKEMGDQPATPRKILLPNLNANAPHKVAKDEGYEEEIETMYPNDDDYPDNFEDVWPIVELPTREELQWLMRFHVPIGNEAESASIDVENVDLLEINDVIELPDISALSLEKHLEDPMTYEIEQAEELLLDDFDLIFL